MIISYIRERGYKGDGHDPLLTIGKAYVVLGIIFRPAPYPAQVCICTDIDTHNHSVGEPYSAGGPGVFDMSFFDIVDSRIPSDWSMLDHGRGYYRLEPNEFIGDFWDRFHDADPDAERTFQRVIEKLEVFHEKPAPTFVAE